MCWTNKSLSSFQHLKEQSQPPTLQLPPYLFYSAPLPLQSSFRACLGLLSTSSRPSPPQPIAWFLVHLTRSPTVSLLLNPVDSSTLHLVCYPRSLQHWWQRQGWKSSHVTTGMAWALTSLSGPTDELEWSLGTNGQFRRAAGTGWTQPSWGTFFPVLPWHNDPPSFPCATGALSLCFVGSPSSLWLLNIRIPWGFFLGPLLFVLCPIPPDDQNHA